MESKTNTIIEGSRRTTTERDRKKIAKKGKEKNVPQSEKSSPLSRRRPFHKKSESMR